ncbi:MAG: hypothetical protein ACRCST_00595 [Turicibacter sp.]
MKQINEIFESLNATNNISAEMQGNRILVKTNKKETFFKKLFPDLILVIDVINFIPTSNGDVNYTYRISLGVSN